jgi:trehalose 6-phosphate synthase
VTALTGSIQDGGAWIAAALSDGDREMAARDPGGRGRIDVASGDTKMLLRYLSISESDFDGYYNYVSNGVLWFLHHYLWDTTRTPVWGPSTQRAWTQYTRVNRLFAEALAEEIGDDEQIAERTAFLVQDYHLSLVPRFLRELRPKAVIAHFSHTPMAGPTYVRILPTQIRRELLRGLLGADVLGFHSEAWAENFLMSARAIPGAKVDLGKSRILFDGREILARVHPMSVEAGPMRALAGTDEVRALRAELQRWQGECQMILRVDRLELSKNIVRGFLAYETFLERYPKWIGRVKFLALLSPSRQDIPEYQSYARECMEVAERINAELGTPGWSPIEVRIRDDYEGAIAAYGLYDVLMVNPVIDGLNLVSMEGPVVNRRHGVLVLSRNAGAYSRLQRYAMGVNPFDASEQAEAIAQSLEMSNEDRRRRARSLSRLIQANPPARWVGHQLRDLDRVRTRRAWFQAS